MENEHIPESAEQEPTFRVERYSDEYKEQVVELINHIMENEFGTHSKSGRPDIRNIPEVYQKVESGDFWIALDENNQVVGTIALSDYGEGVGFLQRFAVKKEFRKKGVGTKLFSHLIDFAKLHQYKEIFLSTSDRRKDAIKFYEKNGWEEVKEVPENIRPQIGKENLFYRLDLKEDDK